MIFFCSLIENVLKNSASFPQDDDDDSQWFSFPCFLGTLFSFFGEHHKQPIFRRGGDRAPVSDTGDDKLQESEQNLGEPVPDFAFKALQCVDLYSISNSISILIPNCFSHHGFHQIALLDFW
ncbi:hypothetical protein L6452_02813 [Arctium lappa]|uniref:Uncharacterized protein n=1 Tax=Arctium lappa TaxID=4217 RepID=A0ACB9FKF1_ARCLA|nr:hypothetical protein L6452_02813 [Arctium lappa]